MLFEKAGRRLAIRRHSALLADGSQLTANSSQLIADSFYLLTVFLTTAVKNLLSE